MSSNVTRTVILQSNGAAILNDVLTRTYPHKVEEEVTLDPAGVVGAVTHSVHLDSLLAGNVQFAAHSPPTGSGLSLAFNPFTVAIDGGTPIPVADLLMLNFNTKPTTITLGQPVGATVPITMRYIAAGA